MAKLNALVQKRIPYIYWGPHSQRKQTLIVVITRSNDVSTGGKRNSQPSDEDSRRDMRKARFSNTPVSPGKDWRDSIPEIGNTVYTDNAPPRREPKRAPMPGKLAVLGNAWSSQLHSGRLNERHRRSDNLADQRLTDERSPRTIRA